MVKTVNMDDRLAINFGKSRALFDLYLVNEDFPFVARVIVIQRVGKLVGDMGIESPTQSDINRLAAATNPQERLAIRSGSLDHFEFNGIPRWVLAIDARMRVT